MSRYVVGIDLGTTNCALAYADTREATDRAPRADPGAGDPAGRRRSTTSAERPVLPVVPLPAGGQGIPRGGARPALEVAGRPRRRHLRARARGQGAGPAGQLGQELALARRASTAARRSCPGRAAEDVDEGLARRGLGRLPGPPPRRLEPRDRRQDGRRPAGAPGRPPDRPRLVRRRRPRADRRGRRERRGSSRSRCSRSRRPPSTPGSPPRATAGGSRSRSATSSSSATSAAGRPTSP